MRRRFAAWLHERMAQDQRVWLLTGDLGYGLWDRVKADYPARYVNPGSAEQLLVDMAIGLALSGKIPIVYSITPFLLYRPFESLRTYINHERIGVKLVGSGRDRDYLHDGYSHWAEDDNEVLAALKNIHKYWPHEDSDLERLFEGFVEEEGPGYLNLRR